MWPTSRAYGARKSSMRSTRVRMRRRRSRPVEYNRRELVRWGRIKVQRLLSSGRAPVTSASDSKGLVVHIGFAVDGYGCNPLTIFVGCRVA